MHSYSVRGFHQLSSQSGQGQAPSKPSNARRLGGKASFCTGDNGAANTAYTKATDLDPNALPAWEGTAEVEVAEGNHAKAVETYRKLVSLTTGDSALHLLRAVLSLRARLYHQADALAAPHLHAVQHVANPASSIAWS